jgi:hypothetical protein
MLGHCRDHPILVFLARPDERDVCVLDPQEGTRASVKMSGALYHSRADQRKPRPGAPERRAESQSR